MFDDGVKDSVRNRGTELIPGMPLPSTLISTGAILITLCSLSTTVRSQPGWVKTAIADAVSAVDTKNQPAVVLVNSTSVTISRDGSSRRECRNAIRVLATEGIGRARFAESVGPGRRLTQFKGWKASPSAKAEGLGARDIVEVAADSDPGEYYENRLALAGFKNVAIGDVVAYEFSIEDRDLTTAAQVSFEFQNDLPTLSASLNVTIPRGWVVQSAGQNLTGISASSIGNEYRWIMSNLAGRSEESFSPPARRLSRTIIVIPFDTADESRRFGSWKQVARWAKEVLDSSAIPSDSIRAAVWRIADSSAGRDEQLALVSRYVQDQIRYVALELNAGRFVPRNAALTLHNRYGDCKDKAALMRSMLNAMHIPSVAVLASLQDTVFPELASPFQFDHCIIAIPASAAVDTSRFRRCIVDGWLYFDPTDDATPLGKISPQLAGTSVLRADDEGRPLTRLPSLSPDANVVRYNGRAILDSTMHISIAVTCTYYDQSADHFRRLAVTESAAEQTEHYARVFLNTVQKAAISDYHVADTGDSVTVAFRVTGTAVTNRSGEMIMLKADPFTDYQARPRIATKRTAPLSFGPPRTLFSVIDWQLPVTMTMDALPERQSDSCSIALFTRHTESHPNGVRISTCERYLGGVMEAARQNDIDKVLSARIAARGLRLVFHGK